MQKEARNSAGMTAGRSLVLALTVATLVLTVGCSSGGTNFSTPTTSNPGPGAVLQKIVITPSNSVILLAESRQLFAQGIYSNGATVDISSSVTWSIASSTTNSVAVSSSGVATANSIGTGVIMATLGSVQGVLQMYVGTNGFSSSTMAVLAVQQQETKPAIDVGYLPQQTLINGAYAVQEVNLDADKFTTILPVPVALMASIAMPSGYVPNAAVALPQTSQVAVISYASPAVQIIDASNSVLDLNSNTITATYQAPVTQPVQVNQPNGPQSCLICAAVVNPLNNQLILSTAQGYYYLDVAKQPTDPTAFTPIQFNPSDPQPIPSTNITLNPIANPPYIFSIVPSSLSTVPSTGEIQVLQVASASNEMNEVTTYSNGLVPSPSAGFIDLFSQWGGVVDGTTNSAMSAQALINFNTLANQQGPTVLLVPNVADCSGGPMNMAAIGLSVSSTSSIESPTLLTSQTGGSCIGIASWQNPGAGLNPGAPTSILYGYGSLPPLPCPVPGSCPSAFVSDNNPNSIATFNSVVDQNNYGILIGGSQPGTQQWVGKINFGSAVGDITDTFSASLEAGQLINWSSLAPPLPILYLPTPSTQLTLSQATINFGTVAVGTSSLPLNVTLTNISSVATLPQQVSLVGNNQGDTPGAFSLPVNCTVPLQPLTNCVVSIVFTPTGSSSSGQVATAQLGVATPGLPTQYVELTGTTQ